MAIDEQYIISDVPTTIAFRASFNLIFKSQSNWSVLNVAMTLQMQWELDNGLSFEIAETTLQMQ